mmetsp:Transcript_30091/g.73236  ORF Transcript_30091/g.73236 Transcript_30091/m.73236 type:complete len:230 (-) Transcript_30091:2549-3238(-)
MVAPVVRMTASCTEARVSAPMTSLASFESTGAFAASTSLTTEVPDTNSIPDSSMSLIRLSTISVLSSFMFGIPYMRSPPTRSARSKTVTVWPALLSWSAAASPAGPEPTIAIRFPVRETGLVGCTQPFSHAVSMIVFSMFLMVTGSSVIPRTQAPSQGAGQTRPVNSGKLLVSLRRWYACSHSPRNTRSFHSGILFVSGHPEVWVWQNGTPHSMHRDACVVSFCMSGWV